MTAVHQFQDALDSIHSFAALQKRILDKAARLDSSISISGTKTNSSASLLKKASEQDMRERIEQAAREREKIEQAAREQELREKQEQALRDAQEREVREKLEREARERVARLKAEKEKREREKRDQAEKERAQVLREKERREREEERREEERREQQEREEQERLRQEAQEQARQAQERRKRELQEQREREEQERQRKEYERAEKERKERERIMQEQEDKENKHKRAEDDNERRNSKKQKIPLGSAQPLSPAMKTQPLSPAMKTDSQQNQWDMSQFPPSSKTATPLSPSLKAMPLSNMTNKVQSPTSNPKSPKAQGFAGAGPPAQAFPQNSVVPNKPHPPATQPTAPPVTQPVGDGAQKKNNPPSWARSQAIHEALAAQTIDPDQVFAPLSGVDLGVIFGSSFQKHKRPRTSSANWEADRYTKEEEIVYKKELGYLD